jgi:hypothetical protein
MAVLGMIVWGNFLNREAGMRRTSLFVILAFFCVSFGVAQDSITIASDPKDLSRPVSTLLKQLRQREKISLTYEDPHYSNTSDIEDATVEVAKNLSAAEKEYGPRILIPKGHPITFVYTPRDFGTAARTKATLTRMLQEYSSLGGPAFTVVGDGIRFHILPDQVLDTAGNRVRQDSILDTVINLPPAQRDGGALLQAICDQIQKQAGYAIGIGPSVPANNLARYQTTKGIDNETARVALGELLDRSSAPGTFVWDLYYDPDDKEYMLNFGYVGLAVPALQ